MSKIFRGATKRLRGTALTAGRGSPPLSLVGATLTIPEDSLNGTLGATIAIVDAAAGTFEVTIAPAATTAIPTSVGRIWFKIQITLGNGDVIMTPKAYLDVL